MKTLVYSLVLAFGFLSLSPSTQAAVFIKFDGVDGESTDKAHQGWSDLSSFSQAISRPVEPASGATRRRGAAVFGDILCVKELDKSSPKIAEAIAQGRVYPKVEIHLTFSGGDGGQTPYYKYELTNVIITSYSVSGSGEEGVAPVDSFSLNFEEIKVTYTEFDNKGGAKGNVDYSWKIEAGEA